MGVISSVRRNRGVFGGSSAPPIRPSIRPSQQAPRPNRNGSHCHPCQRANAHFVLLLCFSEYAVKTDFLINLAGKTYTCHMDSESDYHYLCLVRKLPAVLHIFPAILVSLIVSLPSGRDLLRPKICNLILPRYRLQLNITFITRIIAQSLR